MVPEEQSLTGSDGEQEAREAQLASPQAVAQREASRTKFSNLGPEQAVKIDNEAFPAVINEPAGGPPKLPAGQSITGYLSDNAASVDVGGGRQAVVESVEPIAVQTSPGQRTPINLGLSDDGSSFQPTTPAVGVSIPKRLSSGVALPGVGVSVTPVDGSGVSLDGSEGTVDGATVLYANTQTDMDSLVKPTTDGFEADTLLRSVESPRQLFFQVGLPAGASLVQSKDGSGVVDVVKEGRVIATVLPAGAWDAVGVSVPVSMSVSGDTLMLSVEDRSAEYQYPVEVDPTFIEEKYTESGSKRSNWQWETSNTSRFASKPTDNKETKELSEANPTSLETYGTAAYAESEKAYWAYQTQGDSKIYEFTAETEAKNTEDHIESYLELEAHGTGSKESKELLSDEAEKTAEYTRKPAAPICPDNSKGEQECTSTAGGEGNAVRFQQSVVNKPTSKYSFSDFLYKGEVYLSEPAGTHSTTKYNTSTPEWEIEVENSKKEKVKQKRKNAYGSGSWLSEYDGALEFIAEDPGIGVSATRLEYESAPGKWEQIFETPIYAHGDCTGVQCNPKHTELWTLNKRLPNGEDKIRYRAEDAMGTAKHETESLETEGTETVKVDYSKPHGIVTSGLPYGNELSEKTYELTTYATDGEGSTVASSGIMGISGKEKGIALYIDGFEAEEVGTQTGCSAAKGECTASAKWRISGQKLGAGHHAIVIVAKDRAGNEGREEETISIRHSTPVPMGPGSVDLESGDFTLGGSDVSLGSGLSVSRVYSSRDLTAGAEGGSLLGPQWRLSIGGGESLIELVDGSVLVTSGNGGETIFAAILNSKQEPTGKFEAPPGDSNLTMTLEENEKKEKVAYYLKDPAEDTSTKFTLSSTAKVWAPTTQEGPVPTDTVSYFYETAEVGGKKVTRPSEERGATPAKVSCSPKMEPGCRALKFTYATKTKSGIGEGPSEWGEYEGRLVKVSYEGYNPATKKMTEAPIPVAEYVYDKQGRLRAEWDPRLSPHELKTTYGYDTEGHVTALDPPGQEPWMFTYGTLAGDTGTGRLLKVTRAAASAGLWGGALPSDSEVPKLTGIPAVGVRMAVSSGVWSNSPLVYGYQWERCNAEGKECGPIAGATNANYTAVSGDVSHTLVAVVSATNGGGSVAATSAPSLVVYPKPGYKTENAEQEVYTVACVPATTTCAYDGNLGTLDYATNVSASALSTWKFWEAPSGGDSKHAKALACPTTSLCVLAQEQIQGSGRVHYATSLGGEWSEAFYPTDEALSISCVSSSFCVAGQTLGYFHYTTEPASTEWTLERPGAREENMNSVSCLSKAFCAMADSKGDVHVATTEAHVESTSWTETDVDGSYELNGIACLSTSSCVAVDNAGGAVVLKIESSGATTATKHDIDGTTKLTGVACPASGTCVAVDAAGHVLISKNSGETWSTLYSLEDDLTSVACASSSLCVTGDTAGKVTAFNLTATNPEGEAQTPQPGTTIDYNVPVSGTGAPHNMSTSEVAKWGQKAEETPEEATAIVLPDSPQGWPASSYTRATVYYLDGQGRLVNIAKPSTGTYGSISAMEYNETNDIVRTLSPDNRAAALKEGCESESNCASAKTAKLLLTENTYNGEGEKETEVLEPGTQLIVSRGPEHMVKYVAGEEHYEAGEKPKEAMARSLTKYFYNEGAPTENPRTKKKETYDLATKTENYAELTSENNNETVDVSTTKTSYSGQEDLGWELRAPTSTTAAPGSLNLTSMTEYYESGEAMGKVKETRTPKGSGGNSAHDGKTVYYGEEENKEYKECGKHPEWAGLVCETLPAKQPETTGVPNLPVTKTTYNIWNEPEAIEETFPKSGSFAEHTRTTKDEYDAAGRLKYSGETSTVTTEKTDKALPKITEEYNEKTGLLEKQCTNEGKLCSEGKPKTITSAYNTLGQLESYTDSDGNVTKFKYAGPENDDLLEEMSDGSDEGNSSQKYTYSTTTKQLERLVDSAAGTFTASYDAEGKLASVVYPNGMCANYTDNSVGEATGIEYVKSTTCSEKSAGVWFSESKVPSIRGEVMSKTSTLAKEEYGYDTLGQLTEVHETPVGESCKTRLYAYDEESNRTKQTTREPNSKNECATEGGTVQEHKYDEADRLIDSEITYDPLGNVTKLPSSDAEGHALESTFYVDNAVATQTQNGVTNDYFMDPDGRVRETSSGTQKTITHYDGSGEAVAWTCEGSEEAETCESGRKWTRNIPGIDGTLIAVDNGKGATVETPILQLHDLEGDVAATIKDKTGETKLESSYNSTEFGVPNGGKAPPKFAWLGAGDVEKSLASGVITEGATSYVPQTGRPLQSEEVAPPGLPDGSGAGAPYISQEETWVLQGATREADEAPGLEAGREREAAEKACETAGEGCEVEVDDPGVVNHLDIGEAESQLTEMQLAVICTTPISALKTITSALHIDFIQKAENWVIAHVTGFNIEAIHDWASNLGGQLHTCIDEAYEHRGHAHNPYCWEYYVTSMYHVKVPFIGLVLYEYEEVEYKQDALIKFCPNGPDGCYPL